MLRSLSRSLTSRKSSRPDRAVREEDKSDWTPERVEADAMARRSSSRRRKEEEGLEIMEGLGDVVKTLDVENVVPVDAGFTEVRAAGGYTWLQGDHPMIAVPGVPDVWDPPAKVGLLRPSKKLPRLPEMIDYNASKLPASPLDPLFASLLPDALENVDLITDRANLRKLHSLFSDPADFRVDVDAVGDTIIFSRWEPASRRRQQFMGLSFAPSYVDTVTHPVITGGDPEAGTMCAVKYRFGGLGILVRFEVDAAMPAPSNLIADEPASIPSLTVQPSGMPHPPHDSLIDFKVLPANGVLDLAAAFGQLVWSQTPCVYVARHIKGDFSPPVQKLGLDGPELKAVAEEQEEVLRRMAGLLGRIVAISRRYGRVALVCRDGVLNIHRLSSMTKLSSEAHELILRAKRVECGGTSETLGRSRSLKLGRSKSMKFWAGKGRGKAEDVPLVPEIPA